jgi:CheY-like chemotaxis protein
VVLLDIGLPGLDGWEVARRLREQPGTEGMLIWALTGYGGEEDRRCSRLAGLDLHLVKPVDPEQLHQHLAAVAARLRSVSTSSAAQPRAWGPDPRR